MSLTVSNIGIMPLTVFIPPAFQKVNELLLCVRDSLCSNALPYDKQPLNKYCFLERKNI